MNGSPACDTKVAVGVNVSVSARRTIFGERVFLAQSIPNVPGLLETTPM